MENRKKSEEDENIFIFVPNLIGYGRIFLALLSFWFMPTNYVAAGWCYILSGLLDAFDGHAARALNQSTKFGAMLDMLTDRCATMCLLATLSTFYPKWLFFFQLSMTIGKYIFIYCVYMEYFIMRKYYILFAYFRYKLPLDSLAY